MFAILASLCIVEGNNFSPVRFSLKLYIFKIQVCSLPASSQNIQDWSKYKPRYPTVSPWADRPSWRPLEALLENIEDGEEPAGERYPGYRKGTKSFAGNIALSQDFFIFVMKPQETVDCPGPVRGLLEERRRPPTNIPGWRDCLLTRPGSVEELSSLTSGS